MNLETRKYNLINWLVNINNEGLIDLLESLKDNKTETWDDLPHEVQYGIKEAMYQADKGKFVSHESQQEKYKKYLK